MIMHHVQFAITEQLSVFSAVTVANGKYHRSILQGIELVMRQHAGCEMQIKEVPSL